MFQRTNDQGQRTNDKRQTTSSCRASGEVRHAPQAQLLGHVLESLPSLPVSQFEDIQGNAGRQFSGAGSSWSVPDARATSSTVPGTALPAEFSVGVTTPQTVTQIEAVA